MIVIRALCLCLALCLMCGQGLASQTEPDEALKTALEAWAQAYSQLALEHGLDACIAQEAVYEQDGAFLFVSLHASLWVQLEKSGGASAFGLYFEELNESVSEMAACALAVTGDKPGYARARELADKVLGDLSKNGSVQGASSGWLYEGSLNGDSGAMLVFAYSEKPASGSIWDGLFPGEGEAPSAPKSTPAPSAKPTKPVYKA
ncbi:MAG: hypothetical protein II697_03120 [Clostridia bacterium]|nr:hypothetical protein [Clostridia bacterium]